jgi:hypothetical protein
MVMRLEWSGGSREIGDRPILVGRDPVAADVAIEHDSLLSRLHFALVPGTSSTYLLDLRSSNGTYVNGSRVHYSRLRDGDRIRAGTGRFEFRDDARLSALWQIFPEPSLAFLAHGDRQPYLQFLRNLEQLESWAEALVSAAECLFSCASGADDTAPVAFALGLHRGDLLAQNVVGAPAETIAEILGPALVRARQLDRPFLLDDLGQDLSFLPSGYPIRIEHLGSLVIAPLGKSAEFGMLGLRARSPRARLRPDHLVMVESFSLSLMMGTKQLRQEAVREL